jgi:hypothetical protein
MKSVINSVEVHPNRVIRGIQWMIRWWVLAHLATKLYKLQTAAADDEVCVTTY